MSACIGPMGEYSSHTPGKDDPYTCEWCGVEDTDRMRRDIAALTAAATSIAVEAKAEAWRDAADWLEAIEMPNRTASQRLRVYADQIEGNKS
ncbi:hypothetical protein [Arthrobacter sp. HY1533]|uniref:hypothetical protein n=1 Tax=Arthrobacter sp. HY1533 TaxID=2970919 RepID=UPI0022B9F225|nr:hypothetical protein [Arthrobacter sp. HY1533]